MSFGSKTNLGKRQKVVGSRGLRSGKSGTGTVIDGPKGERKVGQDPDRLRTR